MAACTFFYCLHGTVTKCLGCDMAHSVLLAQAVDLVQQGTEENLVIQDEEVEVTCDLIYGEGPGGRSGYCKEITDL